MRVGMQDPIITLRNMFNNRLTDKNNNNVEIFTYWGEEVIRKAGTKEVWVAIGQPSGSTAREEWLSLLGAGYRKYRSWRYPIFVGGWDVESMYKVTANIMKIIRDERSLHTAHPEYIEFMYVETIISLDRQYEETTPPLTHYIVFAVVEFLEL